MMKSSIIGMIVCIAVLQYKLWFDHDGIVAGQKLQYDIETQQHANQQLSAENAKIEAQIIDLKRGVAAVEERAREDLGFIKKNEQFYQFR